MERVRVGIAVCGGVLELGVLDDLEACVMCRKLTDTELREPDVWVKIPESVWQSLDWENLTRISRWIETYMTGMRSGPLGTEYRVAAYRVAEIQGWFERSLLKGEKDSQEKEP